MSYGRGTLWVYNVGFPVMAVIPGGRSGEGINPFRAPSKWFSARPALAMGASYNVIAAVVNKAIRVYKYWIMLEASGHVVQTFLGSTMIAEHNTIANCPLFMDFSPVGISQGVNVPFTVTNFGSAAIQVGVLIMYSLEPFGSQNDGD